MANKNFLEWKKLKIWHICKSGLNRMLHLPRQILVYKRMAKFPHGKSVMQFWFTAAPAAQSRFLIVFSDGETLEERRAYFERGLKSQLFKPMLYYM